MRHPRLVQRRRWDQRFPPQTFAQAEKLVEVEFTEAELAQAASNWRMAMAPLYERRVGPHKVALPETAGAVVALGPGAARSAAVASAQ